MSQIDYDTRKANALKSSRDQLITESRVATEDLIKAAQEERKKETTNDTNKDKLRDETATRIHNFLHEKQTSHSCSWNQEKP